MRPAASAASGKMGQGHGIVAVVAIGQEPSLFTGVNVSTPLGMGPGVQVGGFGDGDGDGGGDGEEENGRAGSGMTGVGLDTSTVTSVVPDMLMVDEAGGSTRSSAD